jgi:hypothetical protein
LAFEDLYVSVLKEDILLVLGSLATLYTVYRPHHLISTGLGNNDRREQVFAWMVGAEGDMVSWVPVAGADYQVELVMELVDERDDLERAIYCERSTLTEIILHVYDN